MADDKSKNMFNPGSAASFAQIYDEIEKKFGNNTEKMSNFFSIMQVQIAEMMKQTTSFTDVTSKINEALEKALPKWISGLSSTSKQSDIQRSMIRLAMKVTTELQKQGKIGKEYNKIAKQIKIDFAALQKETSKMPDSIKDAVSAIGALKAIDLEVREKSEAAAGVHIEQLMSKLATGGLPGKIAQFFLKGDKFFGEEGSTRRKEIERRLAIIRNPNAYSQVDRETALASTSKTFGKLLNNLGGILGAIGIITFALKKAFDELMPLAGTTAKLVVSTGANADNVERFSGFIINAQASMREMGITQDKLVESTGALVKEFKTIDEISPRMIETNVELAQRFGIAVGTIAKVQKVMMANWRLTNAQVREFVLKLRNDATKYGLSLGDMIEDIAANAENMTQFFGGSADRMREAATYAARLGTTVTSNIVTTKKFSHWADAIQNSFMLSAVTLKSFNARSMYTAAMFGDTQALTKQLVDNLASAGDEIWKMSPLMEQLAETTGKPVEELRRMVESKKLEDIAKTGLIKLDMKDVDFGYRALKEIANKEDRTVEEMLYLIKNDTKTRAELMGRTQEMKEASQKQEQILKESAILSDAKKFGEQIGIYEMQDPQTRVLNAIAGLISKAVVGLFSGVIPAINAVANTLTLGTYKSEEERLRYANSPDRMKFYEGNRTTIDAMSGLMSIGDRSPSVVPIGTTMSFMGKGGKPDMVAAAPKEQWNLEELTEMRKLLKELLTEIQGQKNKKTMVEVYLDGRALAEKLEKYEVQLSTI